MAEVTLYDRGGRPTAYFADDGETVYLWDGRAVAYVADGNVYAWNGRHLGSYEDGIMYDGAGRRVGFVSGRCPSVQHVSPVKYVKKVQHVKGVRHVARARPVRSTATSQIPLRDFLAGARR